MSREAGRLSTAERMRDRMASVHIFPTKPAIDHMPFAGHRSLSEIGNHNDRDDRQKMLRAELAA